MIDFYNSHGDGEGHRFWYDESTYLSKEIEKECERYLKKDIDSQLITTTKTINYHITQKEIKNVNLEKLMFIFPVGFLNSFIDIVEDVPQFIAKKFIQLYKISWHPDYFDLDIVCQAILYCIMNNSKRDIDKSIIQTEIDAYVAEVGESDTKYAKNMYEEIFSNLSTIVQADEAGDIALVYHNYDFKLLFERNFKDVVLFLFSKSKEYNNQYWNLIFKSVGIDEPLSIIQEYQNGDTVNTRLCIIDRSEDKQNAEIYKNLSEDKKKGKIICFPQNKVFLK